MRSNNPADGAVTVSSVAVCAGAALALGLVGGTAIAQPPPDGGPPPRPAVVNIAHRGGIVPGTPENTLAAFRRAMGEGAHVIEIDLRGTKDGAIVVMHDETVDRTTNGHGRVADLTLAEVRALDAGGGERVPTYEDVLALVKGRGVQLLLDIKEGASLDKREVVRLTHAYGATLKVIVGPRSVADLRAFQALDPNLRTLGFIPRPDDLDAFSAAGVHIVRLWPDWIARDPSLVRRVHDLGRPVWTTAGQAGAGQLQELLAHGVNGVLTDHPAVLHELLKPTH